MPLVLAVPTLDGHHRVLRLLQSICGQYLPAGLKVLIVDNASNPPLDLAGLPLPDAPIRILRTERRGLSIARNAALAECRAGDVIIFVDDDMILGEGFFSHYEETFRDPAVEAAGGQIVPVFPQRKPPWYFGRFRSFYGFHKRFPGYRYAGDTPYGGNFGVRYRGDLRPFSPEFGLGGGQGILGEEVAFFRLNEFNAVVYIDEAVAFHHVESRNCTFRWFLRRLGGVLRTRIRMMLGGVM